jgi:hypothetical protein
MSARTGSIGDAFKQLFETGRVSPWGVGRNMVDLITFGLERMLERSRQNAPPQGRESTLGRRP